MKNLKKALCLVLTIAMMMSLMVFTTSAADFNDNDEITNTEAVNTMVALNIINGKPDGSFDPTGIVTRAEMAKMICVALNGGRDPQLGTAAYSFTDTVGNWAAGYIEYCYNLGIIAGRGNGIFDPTGTVTGTEAAKMLLVAIGYDAAAEGFTGASWAMAVNVKANMKDLYDGLSMNVTGGLTRDNAAQMVYNAVQAVKVTYDYKLVAGSNGTLSTVAVAKDDGTNTILSVQYKVKTNYGQLTSIDEDAATIILDANVGTSDTANTAFTDIDTDFSSLIGQSVKVMFKASDDVLGIVPMNNNSVVSTAISAITANGAKVKFGGTSYTLNNGTSGNVTLLKIGTDGVIATNAAATVTTFTTGNTALYDAVKFIDNDGDSYYEYAVQYVVSTGKVTYSSSDEIILAGTTYDRDDDNVPADIAKNDYGYAIYNLFNANYDVTELAKNTATVSVNSAASKYLLDGTWYFKGTGTLATTNAGDSFNYYAYNGVIVYIKAVDTTTSADGVIMVLAVSSGTLNPQAKILQSDGTKTVVDVSDDTTNAPVAGSLYTYSVADDGYDFVNAASFGDYTWVAPVAADITDADGTATASTISAIGSKTIDSSAVVFVYNVATNDGKIITGKQLKTLNADTVGATANYVDDNSAGFFTSSVSGLTRATIIGVKMTAASTLPSVGTDAKLYGLIVDSAYQVDDDYITYKVWTGSETVTVTEKKVSALGARPQFTVIKYSSISSANVISDVTVPTLTATPAGASTAGLLYVAPVVSLADSDLWPNGTTSAGDLDSDTVYMCYDSSTTTAASIGKPAIDLVRADKSVDSATYIPNVKYITDSDGDVVFVLADVKNAVKDTLARGVVGVAATATNGTNTTVTYSKTTGIMPGEAITVTMTAGAVASGDVFTLTAGATWADGTTAAKTLSIAAGASVTYTIYCTGAAITNTCT